VLALHLPITPSAHATEVASARTVKKHTAKPASQTASTKPPVTKSAKIERVETAAAPVVHHKVKTGETLYSIATYYKTTVAAIKRDNRDIAVLRPGMVLIVPQAR
jgi:LysM repeat protein